MPLVARSERQGAHWSASTRLGSSLFLGFPSLFLGSAEPEPWPPLSCAPSSDRSRSYPRHQFPAEVRRRPVACPLPPSRCSLARAQRAEYRARPAPLDQLALILPHKLLSATWCAGTHSSAATSSSVHRPRPGYKSTPSPSPAAPHPPLSLLNLSALLIGQRWSSAPVLAGFVAAELSAEASLSRPVLRLNPQESLLPPPSIPQNL